MINDLIPEFTVSEFTAHIKALIDDNFGLVKINGEVTGTSFPKSGHIYFSLKDNDSLIDVVFWQNAANKITVKLVDGMQVRCIGKLSTYGSRSKYQIIGFQIERIGVGSLMRILQERQERLLKEGLFAADRKRTLPMIPSRICIITSLSGSVIHDIIHRIKNRFACLDVIILPVSVQGKNVSKEIIKAMRCVHKIHNKNKVDVIIIARGGGSLEDLWEFNDEEMARVVARSNIPVVSAIGHETDFTILDHVADLRAPTPTAAAELVTPCRATIINDLRLRFIFIKKIFYLRIQEYSRFIQYPTIPIKIIKHNASAIEFYSTNINNTINGFLYSCCNQLINIKCKIPKISYMIYNGENYINNNLQMIRHLISNHLRDKHEFFNVLRYSIECNNYNKILSMGFGIAFIDNKRIGRVSDIKDYPSKMNLQFIDGIVNVIVNSIFIDTND